MMLSSPPTIGIPWPVRVLLTPYRVNWSPPYCWWGHSINRLNRMRKGGGLRSYLNFTLPPPTFPFRFVYSPFFQRNPFLLDRMGGLTWWTAFLTLGFTRTPFFTSPFRQFSLSFSTCNSLFPLFRFERGANARFWSAAFLSLRADKSFFLDLGAKEDGSV